MKASDVQHRRSLGSQAAALLAITAVACAFASLAPATASAEEDTVPLQFAFMNPLQIFDKEHSVNGYRLSILVGVNRNIRGLDVAGVATEANGWVRGIQIAPGNQVQGDCTGVQLGAFANYVGGSLSGLQFAGGTTYASEGKGVQIAGILSRARKLKGFQFALINMADEMEGLQIGLINFNKNGFLPFFPFFNFGR